LDVPMFVLFGIDIIRFLVDLGTAYALYLAVSLTLNLEAGFSGVPNFGKVMFVAAGAAAAGSVSGRVAAIVLGINTHGDYNGFIATIIPSINTALTQNIVLSAELLLLGVLLAAVVGAVLGFVASSQQSDSGKTILACSCWHLLNCSRSSSGATSLLSEPVRVSKYQMSLRGPKRESGLEM